MFVFRCGHVPLDVIFQRYLSQHILDKVYTEDLHKIYINRVEYARNDFIRSSVSDYDCWLLNQEWFVLPTIRIIKDYCPVVLTCQYHHKGNKAMMIHTPRLPKHILPSKYSDQLAHAVIHSQTVRPMRKTKYSTQYQLYEQKGTFNGIDTFGLTDFHNMGISSELLAHYESLSIVYQKDTNALLAKLSKDKIIGKCVVNDRRKEAKYRVKKLDMDVDDIVSGATYVPIETAMRFIRKQSSSTVKTYYDTESQNYSEFFFPKWPLSLFPCQRMDKYGACFPTLTTLKPRTLADEETMDIHTTMNLWTTLALLT